MWCRGYNCCPPPMNYPRCFDRCAYCCPPKPICIPPKVNCVHRYHCRTIPHICKYHTHVVNHCVNKHVFVPEHSCSEQVVCHDECGC